MKTHWKILIIIGVFLLVMSCISLMTMHIQSTNEVEAYKRLLRERGEKLEISEVMPPPVAAEQNGADLAESAFRLFSAGGIDGTTNIPAIMRMVVSGKAMVGWKQPDVRESRGSYDYTNSWDEVGMAVEIDRPALELLQQSVTYSNLDFRLDYKKNYDLLLPHLALLKHSAFKLEVAVAYDLHSGDPASATTNLCTLLALVQSWHDERTEISQLVRLAMTSIASATTWDLLQFTNVTDNELLILQKKWEQLEFAPAMESAMEMERAFQEDLLKKARVSNAEACRLLHMYSAGGSSSSGDWWQNFQDTLNNARENAGIIAWRTSWSYSDELSLLKYDQAMLEILRATATNQVYQTAWSNSVDQTDAFQAASFTNVSSALKFTGLSPFRWLFSRLTFSPGDSIIRKLLTVQTCKHMVITAIALKRFKLKHGSFPEQTSELLPEFLPVLPLDPIDGKPLRYRRNADGTFLLYSVGDNGVDDGGDPAPVAGVTSASLYWLGNHVRDWVWPQPATAAEIEYFYAHQPK